jgi:hypothetical protein
MNDGNSGIEGEGVGIGDGEDDGFSAIVKYTVSETSKG